MPESMVEASNIGPSNGRNCLNSVDRPMTSPLRAAYLRADSDNIRVNPLARPPVNDRLATRAQKLRSGHSRIAVENRPERFLQFAQPGLEMPPLRHAGGGNGLADLLGACRAHRPLVFVEA